MLVFMLSGLHYADNLFYLIVYFCRLSVKMIIIGMNNCIVKLAMSKFVSIAVY